VVDWKRHVLRRSHDWIRNNALPRYAAIVGLFVALGISVGKTFMAHKTCCVYSCGMFSSSSAWVEPPKQFIWSRSSKHWNLLKCIILYQKTLIKIATILIPNFASSSVFLRFDLGERQELRHYEITWINFSSCKLSAQTTVH